MSNLAGEKTIYKLAIRTDIPIRSDGRIVLKFYSWDLLDLSELQIVTTDQDFASVDGYWDIEAVDVDYYILQRRGGTNPISAGDSLVLNMALIKNPPVGFHDFRVELHEQNSGGESRNADCTEFETVNASDITSFELTASYTIVAGQPFELHVSNAKDAGGNPASGVVTVSFFNGTLASHTSPGGYQPLLVDIYVDGNGDGSALQTLYKVESGSLLKGTVTASGANDLTGNMNVSPGAFGEIRISYFPTTSIAGQPLSGNDIVVDLYDFYGNAKIDYDDQFYFQSSDPDAVLPYTAASMFDFSTTDHGSKTFTISDFSLYNAGLQTITATNGSILKVGNPVQVNSGTISSFEFDNSLIETQVAGDPFELSIINAQDEFGNPASGTITISAQQGGANSPNGRAPVFQKIVVVNGSGSAFQTLYNVEADVILQGISASANAATSSFAVSPGELGSFTLSDLPETTNAGNSLNTQTITATAIDGYGNIKTNFTGSFYFTSTDPQVKVPYTSASQYTFLPAENGVHNFPGAGFEFRTAGLQYLYGKSGAISSKSTPIKITGDRLVDYAFSTVANQVAGVPFLLKVSNAVDQWDNPANDTVYVTMNSGGGAAPNGQQMVLNKITISEGKGSALQSLFLVESGIVFKGTSDGSGVEKLSNSFAIGPGGLGAFALTGVPQQVPTGATFSGDVTVTAFDEYGNEKTNFDQQVSFITSDPDPSTSLPDPYTFISSSQHTFSKDEFILKTLGSQTITVQSGTVSQTSDAITVRGTNFIRISNISAEATTVTQGQNNAVAVSMTVVNENPSEAFTNLDADLLFFFGSTPENNYVIQNVSSGTTIAAGGSKKIDFLVTPESDATLGMITIDGTVNGNFGTDNESITGAEVIDTWTVQVSPTVTLTNAVLSDTEIPAGSSGIELNITLVNNSGIQYSADAVLDSAAFKFFQGTFSPVSEFYDFEPDPANPDTIPGGASINLKYFISSLEDAPEGETSIQASVAYKDVNSNEKDSFVQNDIIQFNAITAPGLQILSITSDQTKVTQGQTNPFTVRIQVQNIGSNNLAIDFDANKTYVKFFSGNQQYILADDVQFPTALDGGATFIQPNQAAFLSFQVQQVKDTVPVGPLNIVGRVETTSGFFTSSDLDEEWGSLQVQAADNVQVQTVTPSQTTVTNSENSYSWQVKAVVKNSGGSDVQLDLNNSELFFYDNVGGIINGFLADNPVTESGNFILQAAGDDTLIYNITTVPGFSGVVKISPSIHFSVINTGESKVFETLADKRGTVTLQNPAAIQVVSVAASDSLTSRNRSNDFTVQMTIRNSGQAAAEMLFDSQSPQIGFYLNGFKSNDFTVTAPTRFQSGSAVLNAGEQGVLLFQVSSTPTTPGIYKIHASAQAREYNRNLTIEGADNSGNADQIVVLASAQPVYVENSISPTTIHPGKAADFFASFTNNGGSDLLLDTGQTRLLISDGVNTFESFLDANSQDRINSGQTVELIFERRFVSQNFSQGTYGITVELVGTENGHNVQFSLADMTTITVTDQQDIVINSITPSVEEITRGQSVPWNIELSITNHSNSTFHLDDAELIFNSFSQGNVSAKFDYTAANTFSNGALTLGAQQTTNLIVTVNSNAADTPIGEMLISAAVAMTDQISDATVSAELANGGGITVLSPAVPEIYKMITDRKFITIGQTTLWQVTCYLRNNGQTGLTFDVGNSQTMLNFDNGNAYFNTQVPSELLSGGVYLPGNSEDSLRFFINSVADQQSLVGENEITAVLVMLEDNTNSAIVANSELTASAIVIAQNKAQIQMDSIYVHTNSEFVNTGQNFYVRALVSHTGGDSSDHINSAVISFTSNTLNLDPDTLRVGNLAPGESRWLEPGLSVIAPSVPDVTHSISAQISEATGRNTGQSITPDATTLTTSVKTQSPANFEIFIAEATEDTVISGTRAEWYIDVTVRNTGDGVVELIDPAQENIQVNLDEDWEIRPPVLTAEQRLLQNGSSLDFRYTVTKTGYGSGQVELPILLQAVQLNDPIADPLQATWQGLSVVLTTSGAVQIVSTRIDTSRNTIDDDGSGLVNVDQQFFVECTVRNVGGQELSEVDVALSGTNFTIVESPKKIKTIPIGGQKTTTFSVQAPSVENLSGDLLKTKIIKAIATDGTGANSRTPMDSTVVVKTHNPAIVKLLRTENLTPGDNNHVSLNQNFQVRVWVQNNGSEAAKNVQIGLESNDTNLAQVQTSPLEIDQTIVKDDSAFIDFDIVAGADTGTVILASSVSSAVGKNTGGPVLTDNVPANSTATAVLQTGAELHIKELYADKQEILAGDNRNPWKIYVVVTDSGKAPLEMVDISADNIIFTVDGQLDTDFEVEPPTSFSGRQGFGLESDEQDTLVYTVVENGGLAGASVQYKVNLSAKDLNTSLDKTTTASDSTTIGLTSNAYVKIVDTKITDLKKDDNNIFYANRGQEFTVNVQVRTGDLIGVDSVVVQISNNSGTFISDRKTILNVKEDSQEEISFQVIADNTWNVDLGQVEQVFTAVLLKANQAGSNLAAERRDADPGDDLVRIYIQNPAEISYDVSINGEPGIENVSRNSQFDVQVHIENMGKAAMGTGLVRLLPPSGKDYKIKDELGNYQDNAVEKNFSLQAGKKDTTVIFNLQAPDLPNSGPDQLIANFASVPNDLNTDQPAIFTAGQTATREDTVYTTEALLSISTLYFTPSGAQNKVISTGQALTINASINYTWDMLNSVAELVMPFNGEQYKLLSPQSVELDSTGEITFDLIAPADTLGFHEFTLSVRATDKSGNPFNTVSKTLEIDKVVPHSTLFVDKLEAITSNGSVVSDTASFVWGQEIQLKANVGLNGAQTTGQGNIQLDFPATAFQLIEGSAQSSYNLQAGMKTDITWKVRVSNAAPGNYNLSARIISPLPQDSNAESDALVTNYSSSLMAKISNESGLTVSSVQIKDLDNVVTDTVSTGQRFKVTALVDVKNNMANPLTAGLAFQNIGFDIADSDKAVTFTGEQVQITWNVIAPLQAGETIDSCLVSVSGHDKYSSLAFENDMGSAVHVVPKAAFALSIPDSLGNRVSTEQQFDLAVEIDNEIPQARYVKNDSFKITLKVLPSPPYTLASERTLTISALDYENGARPQWQFQAPDEPTLQPEDFVFELQNAPKDFYSKTMADISNNRASHRLETIQKATISLKGFVGNPDDGTTTAGVRYGNAFKITALIDDIGLSGTKGDFEVKLVKPSKFLFADEAVTSDTLSVIASGRSYSWNLVAPDTAFFDPDTFKLSLVSPPQDSLSGLAADVLNDKAQVYVWVETGVLLVSDFQVRPKTETIIQKGRKSVPLLGLSMGNRSGLSDTESFLESMNMQFKDRIGNFIDPNSVISKLYITTQDTNQVLAEYSSFNENGQQSLTFDPAFAITGSDPDSIQVFMNIRQDAENKSVIVMLDSTNAIQVRDSFGQPLVLADDKGNIRTDLHLGFQSVVAVIVEERADETFFNYPNPFGRSDRPETKFAYYLEQDSDFDIHIYTLAGELVWAKSFVKSDDPNSFTTAGLHQGQLIWDGKNGRGHDVVNGVYIAYIKTEHDTRARRGIKIAVVR